MTLCVMSGKQCVCQPDEGVPCDSAMDMKAALNVANERIRELEAERKEMFGGSKRDLATKLQQQVAKTAKFQRQYATEREVSDKLENALRDAAGSLWLAFDNDHNAAKADAALREVAAIRAKPVKS